MKPYFILVSIAHDPILPGALPEVLTPAEELVRFNTADEAGVFIDLVKCLASIGYFSKPFLSDEKTVLRIIDLIEKANKNLDYAMARFYALQMAESEARDDYPAFNVFAQKAKEYRPRVTQ